MMQSIRYSEPLDLPKINFPSKLCDNHWFVWRSAIAMLCTFWCLEINVDNDSLGSHVENPKRSAISSLLSCGPCHNTSLGCCAGKNRMSSEELENHAALGWLSPVKYQNVESCRKGSGLAGKFLACSQFPISRMGSDIMFWSCCLRLWNCTVGIRGYCMDIITCWRGLLNWVWALSTLYSCGKCTVEHHHGKVIENGFCKVG